MVRQFLKDVSLPCGSVLCIGRLAATASARNKPTLVVSTTYELWIGNESHEDLEISGDIMGFHKGDWEERVLSGHLDKI